MDEAVEKCRTLKTTLHNLNQYAEVQTHRTPLIPYFGSELEPDRQALMENIQAIHPNHRHRAREVKKAETIIQRRKEFTSSTKAELREFEKELSSMRQNLRPSRKISEIEDDRLLKAKESFLEEQDVRRRQLEEELQLQEKLAMQKREQEKKQMEEYLRWQQRAEQQRKRVFEDLPLPGAVRKVRSHLSVNLGSSDSYGGEEGGHRVPFHTSRSDDQVLPHIPPYKSGKGKPGATPMHHQTHSSDQKRHSAHLEDMANPTEGSFILAPAPKDHQEMHHTHTADKRKSHGPSGKLGSESIYDSLEKVKESIKPPENRARTSTREQQHQQIQTRHSTAQSSLASSSTTSTASSISSNSSGTKSKNVSSSTGVPNGYGHAPVNLQALTMLPSGAGMGLNSKVKPLSPLVTRSMDAKSAATTGQGSSAQRHKDSSTHSKSGIPQSSASSRIAAKVKLRKKQQQVNGVSVRYSMYEYNSNQTALDLTCRIKVH